MLRFFRSSFVYLISSILTALVPFLLLPLLTRYLSPEEYGQAATFQTIVLAVSAIAGLNLHGAISVNYVKNPQTTARYVGTCISIAMAATLLVAAIAISLQHWFASTFDIPAGWLWLVPLCALASSVSNFRLVIWQMADRPLPYGAFSIGMAVTNALLSILLVVYLMEGANGRVASIVAATVLFGALGWLLLWWGGQVKHGWNSESARNALRFGLPLVPHALAGMALMQGDRLIIAERLGISAAGIYAVAMQLALPIWMGAEALNRAYAPWLFRQLAGDGRRTALMVTIAGAVAVAGGSVVYAVAAYLFLDEIVGANFVSARDLIFLLVPGMAAQAMYYLGVNFIFFSERTRYLPAVTGATALAYVVGGSMAASSHGAAGLAATFSLVQLCQTLAVFGLAAHTMSISRQELADAARHLLPGRGTR
jgi:O-antigen/teichoic acid export membrane protein